MNQILLGIANSMGIDVTKYTTDEALGDAIKLVHQDNAAKITKFTSEMQTLKTEVESLKKTSSPAAKPAAADPDPAQARIESLENLLFTGMVDDAITAGKILPAQRDSIIAFAKSNYAECKKLIDATPVNSVLAAKSVPSTATPPQVDLKDPKFTMDGQTLTYAKVIKDPELMRKFNDEELEVLKQAK